MPLTIRQVPAPEPAKRGPKEGSKMPMVSHVCPWEDCPRQGEPFMAGEQATYCSRRCGLCAWRAKQKSA